jgi:hypothetical protein
MVAKAATWRLCLAVNGPRVALLTLFFIALPLLPVGPPSRNGANYLVSLIVVEVNSVGHQQLQYAVYRSDRLPTNFAALNAILFDKGIRIAEDLPGDFEADSMFSAVGLLLGTIPLEPYHAMPLL